MLCASFFHRCFNDAMLDARYQACGPRSKACNPRDPEIVLTCNYTHANEKSACLSLLARLRVRIITYTCEIVVGFIGFTRILADTGPGVFIRAYALWLLLG